MQKSKKWHQYTKILTKSARIWQKNTNINAQQAINQVFSTRFEKMAYYESNLLKNKGAHVTCSLDEPVGNQDDDKGHTLGDFIADEANEIEKEGDVTGFIQSLLDKDKVVEAIIFDNIADPDKDVFKYKKKTIKTTNADGEKVKYIKHTSEFWEFKLIKELNELDGNYKNYFLAKYKVFTKKNADFRLFLQKISLCVRTIGIILLFLHNFYSTT